MPVSSSLLAHPSLGMAHMARTSKARQARRICKAAHWAAMRDGAGVGAIGYRSTLDTRHVQAKAHTHGCHVPFPRVREERRVPPSETPKALRRKLAVADRACGWPTPDYRKP